MGEIMESEKVRKAQKQKTAPGITPGRPLMKWIEKSIT